MMYDDRYQRRQARRMRRANRRYYRNTFGGISGGIFLIGLALAFALSSSIGGHLFLPIFFAALAFCALFGSVSSFNAKGLYGGFQGFVWLLGLAFCFLFGFWPWILVVIGVSCILGTLYAPLTAGLMGAGMFAAMQNNPPNQQYPQYQPPYAQEPYQPNQQNQPYQPYQPYQQGYQPQPPDQPGTYIEGDQQYQYPPAGQPKQEHDLPEIQYPQQQQELPPQQQ
jgi:hypothetical protein